MLACYYYVHIDILLDKSIFLCLQIYSTYFLASILKANNLKYINFKLILIVFDFLHTLHNKLNIYIKNLLIIFLVLLQDSIKLCLVIINFEGK